MEMEEEYSGSDADSARFNNDQSTWQEIQDENEALKNQILGQIAIFEQYLKVAIL